MTLAWRFTRYESLEGRGGLRASARWHTRGHEVLYCAPNPATALLEVLVRAGVRDPDALAGFLFLKLDVPDTLARQRVDEALLPPDWSRRLDVTRAWGDRWLREASSPLLVVRSVLVPETYNLLINPRHPDASQVQRTAIFPYPLDVRLLDQTKRKR